jgi:uncharacterized protein YcbK (DUF882 family)
VVNIINNFDISKNFNLQEFECTHPEHRHVRIDRELVDKLQQLRDRLGVPLVINSAYRCPERNKQVGGADNSQHLYGKAADISLHTIPVNIETLRDIAEEIGFNGIGLYDSFIHLDIRHRPARWDNRK